MFLGSAVREEQAQRRKPFEKRLLTDGVYYPQPPPPRRPKSAYTTLGQSIIFIIHPSRGVVWKWVEMCQFACSSIHPFQILFSPELT